MTTTRTPTTTASAGVCRLLFLCHCMTSILAFSPAPTTTKVSIPMRSSSSSTSPSLLSLGVTNKNSSSSNKRLDLSFFEEDEQEMLDELLMEVRRKVYEMELSRPPTNTDLTPTETVRTILEGLMHQDDPLPDSGFRLLLHTATTRWKSQLLNAVGASPTSDPEIVASALGSSIGRPHNKYAILISPPSSTSSPSSSSPSSPEYVLKFTDYPLEFDDGTCWVECMLLDPATGELLVMTGWDLRQRQHDGAWLVDSICWQDFREEFISQNKIEYLVA
eukprot:CAMPEP_0113467684 /NCGR_PEP_ID=MMETSP0014_2-20120614/14948_1 /TAXON_ID=2857 /ORGANISM="Nitzschia sp." /LENGTH=275 /DNA_ID=CAMNT_0000360013 /DNA_START=254 /DNA_END=1081 /DNA_ORIENTATION=- /assembly_acc=CAM_ASM_000159